MLPKPLPPEFADIFAHRLRIAVDADALAPWQIAAIAITTLLTAAWVESRDYARRRTLVPGFRAGALMGLLVSSLSGIVLGWLSYRTLASGAIKCLSRRCRGTDFTDLLGHRHFDDKYVSMTFDAPAFWFSYGLLTCFTLGALIGLFCCIRALAHWDELD